MAGYKFVPLPAESLCCSGDARSQRNLLAERLIGDGLVPLNSALGRHPARARQFRPKAGQWIGYEMGHLELLCRHESTPSCDWLQ